VLIRPYVQVEADGRDAESIQRVVAQEENDVKAKQVETQALKDDAQKDLEEVRFAGSSRREGVKGFAHEEGGDKGFEMQFAPQVPAVSASLFATCRPDRLCMMMQQPTHFKLIALR
jgi:hypothetical protein